MKKILCIILALTFFVVSSAATSLSSAVTVDNEKGQIQENYSFTAVASEEQLKLINKLRGKEMTRLEFFEAVYPDIVSKLSDKQKKLYASMPFKVTTPGGEMPLEASE